MIHAIANELKKGMSTHIPLIYTEMLSRSYILSILDIALDFNSLTSNKNSWLQQLFSLSILYVVFI